MIVLSTLKSLSLSCIMLLCNDVQHVLQCAVEDTGRQRWSEAFRVNVIYLNDVYIQYITAFLYHCQLWWNACFNTNIDHFNAKQLYCCSCMCISPSALKVNLQNITVAQHFVYYSPYKAVIIQCVWHIHVFFPQTVLHWEIIPALSSFVQLEL